MKVWVCTYITSSGVEGLKKFVQDAECVYSVCAQMAVCVRASRAEGSRKRREKFAGENFLQDTICVCSVCVQTWVGGRREDQGKGEKNSCEKISRGVRVWLPKWPFA